MRTHKRHSTRRDTLAHTHTLSHQASPSILTPEFRGRFNGLAACIHLSARTLAASYTYQHSTLLHQAKPSALSPLLRGRADGVAASLAACGLLRTEADRKKRSKMRVVG